MVCVHRRSRPRFWPLFALIAALLFTAPAFADPHEQDAVREAVESGAIRPLADILDAVHGRLPGDIVAIEIEHKRGLWLYEFRVVDGSGRLFEVYVDARSGAIERIKEK
jgi:uncharacterized membrane protein YkoI